MAELSVPLVDHGEDVGAGRLAALPEGDDLPDLSEGEPHRLGGPDEGQPVEMPGG